MGVIQARIPETVFDGRRRDGKVKKTCFENTFKYTVIAVIVYIRLYSGYSVYTLIAVIVYIRL